MSALAAALLEAGASQVAMDENGANALLAAAAAGYTPVFTALLAAGADHLVLGCTHFPHLKPLIEKVVAGRAEIVDPAPAVARRIRAVLAERDLLCAG